jgi:hypothetical protein
MTTARRSSGSSITSASRPDRRWCCQRGHRRRARCRSTRRLRAGTGPTWTSRRGRATAGSDPRADRTRMRCRARVSAADGGACVRGVDSGLEAARSGPWNRRGAGGLTGGRVVWDNQVGFVGPGVGDMVFVRTIRSNKSTCINDGSSSIYGASHRLRGGSCSLRVSALAKAYWTHP